jgi:hypothetical protein
MPIAIAIPIPNRGIRLYGAIIALKALSVHDVLIINNAAIVVLYTFNAHRPIVYLLFSEYDLSGTVWVIAQ